MSEDDLIEQIIADGAPHPLARSIPSELRGVMLEVAWNQSKLWSIRYEPDLVAVDDLRWHLELPWWSGDDGEWFRVRPADVMAAPARFPVHAARIDNADLAWPVHVLRRRDRWLVLDGIHRLAKAELAGVASISAIRLHAADLAEVVTLLN